MAYATLAGMPVSRGLLVLPRQGRGHATLRLATAGQPLMEGDAAILQLDAQTFSMTITRAGRMRGAWMVRAVLGKDQLKASITAKYYRDIPRTTIVKDILSETGETAGSIDLPGTAMRYVRRQGSAHDALRAALEGSTRLWHFTPAGELTVVPDAPTAYGTEGRVAAWQPARKMVELLPLPDLLPGQSISLSTGKSITIDRVAQQIGSRLITEVHYV